MYLTYSKPPCFIDISLTIVYENKSNLRSRTSAGVN